MEELSILDQLPFMSFYSQILLCFPLAKDSDRLDVITDLEKGLQTLIGVFPFLTKQVIREHDERSKDASSGTHKLVPHESDGAPKLHVKYLDGQFPSYEEISKFKAPASILDGGIVAPMKSLPDTYDFATAIPVLVIQANFVSGGLLLCFAAMHNVLDGNGLGHLIRHFATVCRGEDIQEHDIWAGNIPRKNLIPTLGPDEMSLDHSLMLKELHNSSLEAGDKPLAPWTYFRLSAVKLAALKTEASHRPCTNPQSSWISTNDAVSALIWRAVVAARSPHLNLQSTSTLVRAVNGRRRFQPAIPDTYLGVCVISSSPQLTLGDLTQKLAISEISTLIRKELEETGDYYARSFTTMIQSEPDRRKISFGPPSPDTDVLISSWASLPIYTSDFGGRLGKPELVRRPTFSPCDGLTFIMPRNLEGDLDVVISLHEEDMERVKNDPVWRSYADVIG